MEDVKETHPSYGLIRISRTTGGGKEGESLFGSPIKHLEGITLTISRGASRRNEDLHHTWYSREEELVEVELSPAQFAEVITSLNMGQGTPCTIRYVGRERMPSCPDVMTRERIEREFQQKMRDLTRQFDDGIVDAQEILAKKSLNKEDRQRILNVLEIARRTFGDHVPFAMTQFNEAVDTTVREAKAEVDAFFTSMIHTTGLEALGERVKVGALSLE